MLFAMTIFGKIVRGEIPAKKVFEDDEVLAFRDITPQAPVHILIIPKREIPAVRDAKESDTNLLGKLLLTAAQVARQEGIEQRGYRLVINTGGDGGQTVNHLHVHLLGGRALTWPPG